MTLDEKLREIEERVNACLEGPWEQIRYGSARRIVIDARVEIEPTPGDEWKGEPPSIEDAYIEVATVHPSHGDDALIASFIAHARADVPALLRALRAVLDKTRNWTILIDGLREVQSAKYELEVVALAALEERA